MKLYNLYNFPVGRFGPIAGLMEKKIILFYLSHGGFRRGDVYYAFEGHDDQ